MSVHAPFELGDGPTGVLLIHGFSGSPAEMRGLGERLARDGHRVLGVQLAGHTGNPAALLGSTWRGWLASAETGFERLQSQCTDVYTCGFSLGGALATLLASRRRVQRLVLLATPTRLSDDWRVALLPVARYLIPWFYPLQQANFADPFLRQKMLENDPTINLDDVAVQQALRTAIRMPTAAIDQAAQAVRQGRRALPQVRVPALVMQGSDDEVVPRSADEIYRLLGSGEKERVWWEHTGHQLLVSGPQREAIIERVAEFCR